MTSSKGISSCGAIIILISLCFQCSTAPKLQKEAPEKFDEVYFQKWNAGVEKGGSGIDIYIEVKNPKITLDSVYVRNQSAKLYINPTDISMYVGRFKSSDKSFKKHVGGVFNLQDNECVISYIVNNETFYYKIENITERQTINYPISPSGGH